MLSAVLGSVAAALAVLALDGVDAVVLVTVVLLVVVVLGVAVAGLGTGSVADPAPGRSTVGAGATGRLARATGHLAPVGLPRRRRGALGLDHHMRRHGPWGIHHPAGAEGPAHWRHKSRGHKRPARACDAAIGTGRIEPRGVDGQPAPGRADALRSRRQEGDTGVGSGGR